jgi:hypothetical protein
VYQPLMRSALRCSQFLQRSSEFFNKLKEDTIEGIDFTKDNNSSASSSSLQPSSSVSAVKALRATWDDPTVEELLEDAYEDDIAANNNNKVCLSIASYSSM